jgi:hypothetical protein
MGNDTLENSHAAIRHLRELIDALERRVPNIQREGEMAIAREAAALKARAIERLAELEKKD